MRHTRARVDQVFPNMTHAVVGGFVFLRFLCPAIISPHKFGLTSMLSFFFMFVQQFDFWYIRNTFPDKKRCCSYH